MNTPKFFKKDINIFLFLISVLILITVIGIQSTKITNLQTRVNKSKRELQEDSTRLTSTYGVEEYILNWNGVIDGFEREYEFISSPKYYLTNERNKVSDTWILRGGYRLELDCPEIADMDIVPEDPYGCKVSYNDQLIRSDVRFNLVPWGVGKSTPSYVDLVVYSPHNSIIEGLEILALGGYRGGEVDDIYIYRLEDGEAELIPFSFQNELLQSWSVESSMSIGLYYNTAGDVKLVTAYYDHIEDLVGPVIREWKLGKNSLTLEKSFGISTN